MESDKQTNQRIKDAARSEIVPAGLDARIRDRIETETAAPVWQRFSQFWRLAVVACALAALFVVWSQRNSEESYIARMSSTLDAGLLRVGLGDHIHCSVYRKPKAIEKVLVKDLGERYVGFAKVVERSAPSGYRLVSAHRCKHRDRVFVHLTVQANSGKQLSLLLTRKEAGETLGGRAAALAGGGAYAVDAFESAEHVFFVVSSLDAAANSAVMNALAAPMVEFLRTIETVS